MTWFRVDDKFYSHEKVQRIPREVRAEAVGTWALCGTWSAHHERDGFVPDFMIDELGGTAEGTAALIAVDLWRRRRDGVQFVNWREFQPTRAENAERRKAESQRKAEWRARKARESAGVSADVPAGQTRHDTPPSRPVPSREEVKQVPASSLVEKRDRNDDIDPVAACIIDTVAAVCRRDIHALVAWDVAAFLDERRGPRAKPLQNPARYYARAIEGSPAEVQQFIDTEGIAS